MPSCENSIVGDADDMVTRFVQYPFTPLETMAHAVMVTAVPAEDAVDDGVSEIDVARALFI
jgi:hypothetical protein